MRSVCVVGPRDRYAPAGDGLGFDIGPLVDTISQAGQKYLDYKQQQAAAKQAAQMEQNRLIMQQRQVIAGAAGGITGGTLALIGVGLFALLMLRKR